ncbi:MAG: molecular chaperone DnaJ [Deltaproteobacteria bacterium]|jgi:molecular chaperone DnaJ|nr:molecular chaperone DnaJ [Deltaproteobacteria bacterium]
MAQRDYYEILGVDKKASGEAIKKAYRAIALQLHPDRNPGDAAAEAAFKEAAEAYDLLRDPEKRARYDRFGHAGLGGGSGFSSAEDIFSHFGDIFGDFLGFSMGARGARARNLPRQGADLRYNLEISFRQAAKGASIDISIPRSTACPECRGRRTAPGTSTEACRQCGGLGQVRHSQGFFQISVPCPACRGEGVLIPHPCPRCKGRGIIQEMRELKVRIPPGVDSGNRLRLRGEGEGGLNGGPNGDLYVVLNVEDDATFERDGQNLLVTREISFVQAALGDTVEVPCLEEAPLSVAVPKGAQNGEVFRIAGKGLPYPGSNRTGDLLVAIKVLTPTRLNARQEEILREFSELEKQKTLTKAKTIIRKIGKAMGVQ